MDVVHLHTCTCMCTVMTINISFHVLVISRLLLPSCLVMLMVSASYVQLSISIDNHDCVYQCWVVV